MDERRHPFFPGGHMQLFVGPVEVVVVEREAGQDRIDTQRLFEHQDGADPAAHALEDWLLAEGGAKRIFHGANLWRLPVHDDSVPTAQILEVPFDCGRRLRFQILTELLVHIRWFLIWYKAERDARGSFCRDGRFWLPARDEQHLGGRTRADAFRRKIFGFSPDRRRAGML